MAYQESLTEKLGMRVAGGTGCLPGSAVQYRSAHRALCSAAVCFLICRMAREGLLGGLSAGGHLESKGPATLPQQAGGCNVPQEEKSGPQGEKSGPLRDMRHIPEMRSAHGETPLLLSQAGVQRIGCQSGCELFSRRRESK